MVDSVVTKQELIDAKKDAQSLEDVINGMADTRVKPRIGPEMWTLATINSLVQQGQIKISDLSEAIQVALAAGAGSAGWTANLVADGNQTQKEINLYGGKKYDMPAGGYPAGAVVRLENGDIVKSTAPNNTKNPNTDMTGWVKVNDASQIFDGDKNQKQINSLINSKKLIDTRLYGVIADTSADMTMPIQMAMAANPKSVEFYIPEGMVLCNIVVPRSNITFVGSGLGVTKLNAFDPTKSTINYNKKLYQGLRDITVHAPHNAIASIINARDSRYISYNRAEIFQLANELGEFSYSVRGLDLRPDTVYWTGYNYFKESRFNRCMYGVDGGGAPFSSSKFDDCILSFNGYFGAKLDGVVGGGMNNCDIATNGQIAVMNGEFDETKYGGVWVKGSNFKITGAWHELNRSKFSESDMPNDVYIHPDSNNVREVDPRRQRTNLGVILLSQTQAEQTSNYYSDTVGDSGMGQSKSQTLIKNGGFKHNTTAWLLANGGGTDFTAETSDLPNGFEFGIKATTAGAIRGLYQKIYVSGEATNAISNLSKYIGKTLTMTCWVKNLSSSKSAIRVGFDTGLVGSGVYFSAGSYAFDTPLGQWVKVIVTHKILGTEPRIMVGFRTLENCIIAGARVQFGDRVGDYEPKNLTESGGECFGDILVNGAKVITEATQAIQVRVASNANIISAASSINTDKRHPSFVFNSTTGKMYFSTGNLPVSLWRCTDGSGDITPT